MLVQLGDILDRGEDELAILSLLKSLDIQAKAHGGAVFQVCMCSPIFTSILAVCWQLISLSLLLQLGRCCFYAVQFNDYFGDLNDDCCLPYMCFMSWMIIIYYRWMEIMKLWMWKATTDTLIMGHLTSVQTFWNTWKNVNTTGKRLLSVGVLCLADGNRIGRCLKIIGLSGIWWRCVLFKSRSSSHFLMGGFRVTLVSWTNKYIGIRSIFVLIYKKNKKNKKNCR